MSHVQWCCFPQLLHDLHSLLWFPFPTTHPGSLPCDEAKCCSPLVVVVVGMGLGLGMELGLKLGLGMGWQVGMTLGLGFGMGWG